MIPPLVTQLLSDPWLIRRPIASGIGSGNLAEQTGLSFTRQSLAAIELHRDQFIRLRLPLVFDPLIVALP